MTFEVSDEISPIAKDLPWINREQMLEIERALRDDFGVELAQMIENAGRNLAHLARARFCDGEPQGKRVVVLAGTGLNGGGAFACARRLVGWGAEVEVFTTADDDAYKGNPGKQLNILREQGVSIERGNTINQRKPAETATALIIDGIIGYHLRGAPKDCAAKMIHWANSQQAPILSLDTPTGLELSGGYVHTPAISATATMTVALPKEGLAVPASQHVVGELYLADIGVPPELYSRPPLFLEVPQIFARSEIIRLR